MAQMISSSPSYAGMYAGMYADKYGSRAYIPGCTWDRYKFTCHVSAFNYIDMKHGRILINPKRKK